jgi:23S rRNA (uracil1939-C5)-methyltransferase
MKIFPKQVLVLEKIVGGGQALGTLADGRRVFVWGGLPGEKVEIQLTKSKSKMAEAVVTEVIEPSKERTEPKDPESYLSTSPWQIMSEEAETRYKAKLIDEAFELHHISLPHDTQVYGNNTPYNYRNKVEFSWYGDDRGLHLAFYRRGTHGKITVEGTSLAREEINHLARQIRDALAAKAVEARDLKTLLIRCDQTGNAVWQLYVKDPNFEKLSENDIAKFAAQGGEVIYSDPRSPASRITKRLASFGNPVLTDTILETPFRYATEGFFQVNIPVYEQALRDMQEWIPPETAVVDMYSGVGTIGLTIGGENVTLVEVNEDAVREMRANIEALHVSATAVLASSEKALEYITPGVTIILDPPRAGLHDDVAITLLEALPPRIVYLSCNPVTQARDVQKLLEKYTIVAHKGYNFFPHTPHIEHLIVLEVQK